MIIHGMNRNTGNVLEFRQERSRFFLRELCAASIHTAVFFFEYVVLLETVPATLNHFRSWGTGHQ